MIIKIAEEELKLEKKKLEELLKSAKLHPRKTLLCCTSHKNSMKFYYKDPGGKRRIYIRRSEHELLRNITYGAVLSESIKIIRKNINAIENLINTYKPYAYDDILKELPKAYQQASEFLETSAPPPETVIQSENPYHREDLKHKASNGLKVRSKNELIITEELSAFNLNYRYEMALKLIENIVNPDGTVYSRTVTKYPDFTIFLKDGSVIYWEHSGKFDK